MLLYGRISVLERLRVQPESIRKILLQDNVSLPKIEKLIATHNIPLERMASGKLSRKKSSKDLQGILAEVAQFKYASFDDLLSQTQKNDLSLIFLDRINDPHNLGAVIRTIACLGKFAVVIPQSYACGITEAVLHVASGGENYVSVSKVPNLSTAIVQAKKRRCWIVGAESGSDASDITKTSFPFPLGLVLGSEGEGIRYGIQKHLDMKVCIPMKGAALSFNVGVACAIFCHEIAKQRENKKKGA